MTLSFQTRPRSSYIVSARGRATALDDAAPTLVLHRELDRVADYGRPAAEVVVVVIGDLAVGPGGLPNAALDRFSACAGTAAWYLI